MKATAPKETKKKEAEPGKEKRDFMYALSFAYNIVQVGSRRTVREDRESRRGVLGQRGTLRQRLTTLFSFLCG